MKGYKAILEQHALHDTPQLQKLIQTKRQFDKFISNFVYLEKQINDNVKNINTCFHQVQQKAATLLYNLTQEINDFTAKRKANYNNMVYCGCGFETQSGEAYVEHLKNIHQSLKYVKGSTHFATFLGNVLKCDSFMLQNIQGSKTKPKRKENPTPIKQDKFTKVKNRPVQNKSKDILEKTEKIDKPLEVKEMPASNKNFMCGECLKQFQGYKLYSLHMRAHDYIIHPNSSHIIIRKKKGMQFIYLNVHDDSYKNKKFSCPCNPSSSFSKDQFVKHAFKWHKGIVPVK